MCPTRFMEMPVSGVCTNGERPRPINRLRGQRLKVPGAQLTGVACDEDVKEVRRQRPLIFSIAGVENDQRITTYLAAKHSNAGHLEKGSGSGVHHRRIQICVARVHVDHQVDALNGKVTGLNGTTLHVGIV